MCKTQVGNRVMPSKTRGSRTTASKENIYTAKTNKTSGLAKVLKSARQPLTDKTNSGSDDASVLPPEKTSRTVSKKQLIDVCQENLGRPKRVRRVPIRFQENSALDNLSISYDLIPKQPSPDLETSVIKNKSSSAVFNISQVIQQSPASKASFLVKKKPSPGQSVPIVKITPLKSPVEKHDKDLVLNRPRRICHLPSKFNDHSISPNKFIPVQPINASTPLVKKSKQTIDENVNENINFKMPKKRIVRKATVSNSVKHKSADNNNNAEQSNKQTISPLKLPPKLFRTRSTVRKVINKCNSPLLLDNKTTNKNQNKRDSSKLDVYEFTYNPEDEPPPAKKKKKKSAPRRPKPKTVPVKSKYEKNLAKALAALKSTVAANREFDKKDNVETHEQNLHVVKEKNYNSILVEDIACDMHSNEADHVINYSPVNSPSQPKSPIFPVLDRQQVRNDADPLNLQDDTSFFDELPIANSSMNRSVRHPLASPWRVEFGDLPIRWQVNAHVKPNMTPAIESSFINFNDSKKKHVYTNIVPESNDQLPQMDNNTNNFKQTSIMSFIKEVVEKSASKKNRSKLTPVKANSLFEDLTTKSFVNHRTPNKQTVLKDNTNISPETGINGILTHEKQHSNILNQENVQRSEDLNKNVDKNNTFFGFDDVENQENVYPIKKNHKARSLRSRTRGILQEINEHKGPTRAIIPVAAKSKPVENAVNKVYEGVKSATEPPVFPKAAVTSNTAVTNLQETCLENVDSDSQSVHLFEDIECLHHCKAKRKSYGKDKKVKFPKKSVESEESDVDRRSVLSMEDNSEDLSFKLPSEAPKRRLKKRKPKKLLSKKEEKEVEAWAAGFNSMCEDIDGFDLVVE